jgi:hypothetical protein
MRADEQAQSGQSAVTAATDAVMESDVSFDVKDWICKPAKPGSAGIGTEDKGSENSYLP